MSDRGSAPPGTAAPAYPRQWEADVVLADGGTVHLRPIRPDDADALVALHARLSDQTRYYRFFGAYPQIPPRDLERFTVVDYDRRLAIVAALGADLIGVARYDRTAPGQAEVAFVIEDVHQGRGLGPLLLEHLAAAARERGVVRFDADVLPTNRRMLRVFLDAGYRAERAFDGGTVHVTFAIEPTAESMAAAYAREHRAEAQSIRRLLTPASVAVIGASEERYGVGRAVLANVLAHGFTGPVFPVHPTAPEVAGLPAYRSVLDIPQSVDLAVVALPAPAVLEVVTQCAAKGVHGLVIVSAGFAETGEPAGVERQAELVRVARAHGMRVVGPNCLGILNSDPAVRLNATLAATVPDHGRIGMFSQSGSLGSMVLAETARRGLGLSTFVSAGNRADVSGNDVLQFWEEDDATGVVLLYLETFGNPHKFGRLARRISLRKPVIVVRAGRVSALVPVGHRVDPLRLPPQAEDELFAQTGVVRVDTLAQALDVAAVFAHQPLPAGDRVAIVGNSFAVGLLAMDACLAHGLHVAGGAPIDLGAHADAAAYDSALAAAGTDDGVDAVVVVFVPPLVGDDPDVRAVVARHGTGAHGKPVVSTFLAQRGLVDELGPVPSFDTPETAVQALAQVMAHAAWRRRPVGALPDLADLDVDAARQTAAAVLVDTPAGRRLTDDESARLLREIGVRVWPGVRARSVEAALLAARRLGWPVAVKAAEEHLRHRVDLGAVRLDVRAERDLRAAYEAIAAMASGEVIVQRMAPPGVAVTVETRGDPRFGALVSVGVGGIATQLLGDRAYRAVPLTDVDAAEMVRSLRAAPLLLGWRGADPVDVKALEDLLLRVSELVDEVPEVRTLRLGTVLVNATGLAVLEAQVEVAPSAGRADVGPRRLNR
ncbi:MAG TPA: GNAT family N-acetyltransferase [Mycobacteriales bacterium]|nr:GNAT family N-acetyltransferase [Mycobacteriales bacterium]